MKLKILKENYLLIMVLATAAFVRFTGLTWASPFNPHPDEWNMAAAISQMSLREGLNPHFFAYGQFPLYLSFFSAKIYNLIPWIHLPAININEATFFLRFWSAIAGVGTVYLVYLISRRLFIVHSSLFIAVLAAFTPGLVQISHFGTTESLLSFFFLAIIYFSLKIKEKPILKYFLVTGLFLGLALGTKISALVFLSPLFFVTVFLFIKTKTIKGKLRTVLFAITALTLTLTITILTSPYLIANFDESKRILLYETQVATGVAEVFYTRQFFNTIPVIFQFTKIFPYALGLPIFIMGILGFIVSFILLIRAVFKRRFSWSHCSLFIVHCSFLTYFFSQAFLFCKWTRFMSPIFAFFPIFASFFLLKISLHLKNRLISLYLNILISLLAIVPGIIFSSIYFRPDIRFIASDWIYKNIPDNSKILYDTGNVVDIPFPSKNHQLPITNYQLLSTSFDFYHLDENPELFDKLMNELENSDYIFVPSRRIFSNHLRLPEKFPLTAKYYELLFSGKLGFKEMKVFRPLPSFQISKFLPAGKQVKFQINDEQSEETFTVFDHPMIRIYQKTVKLTKEDCEKLF